VTPDLRVIGIETGSPSAIADAAGNNANLAGAGVSLGLGINTAPGAASGTSGGNFTISGGMELELFGASTAAATFASGSTGTLKLDASAQFAGTVAGLALGSYLDLADVAYRGDSTPVYKPSGTRRNRRRCRHSRGRALAHRTSREPAPGACAATATAAKPDPAPAAHCGRACRWA
jgi:hypothetical protein